MPTENPRSTARIAGHPIHPMLVPFPIVCFVGALVTDVTYAQTTNLQWANFSSWLLTAGLVMSVFVAIAGITDFLGDRRIRQLRPAWIHAVGNVVAVVLALINAFVHTRDGYTGVVPTGLILSAITVLILLVTGWNGWDMVYRHRVGIAEETPP
jgi:uncharacterized membrane protein